MAIFIVVLSVCVMVVTHSMGEYIRISSVESPCSHQPCLTLEQFSDNASLYSGANTPLTLDLLPGNHTLSSYLTLVDISSLKIFSVKSKAHIVCTSIGGGFQLINVGQAQLTNVILDKCGSDTKKLTTAAALIIKSSAIVINSCVFINSRGLVIHSVSGNISDNDSLYTENNNGIFYLKDSYSKFCFCKINNNSKFARTLIIITTTTSILHRTEINNNVAEHSIFFATKYSNITIDTSILKNNSASFYIIFAVDSYYIFINATTVNNKGSDIIYFVKSRLEVLDQMIISDNHSGRNTLGVVQGKGDVKGLMTFSNNFGSFFVSDSKVTFSSTVLFRNCSSLSMGGAMTTIDSSIEFLDSVVFINNYSEGIGGAVCGIGTKMFVWRDMQITSNMAHTNGGGIYLHSSTLICETCCNFSGNIVYSESGKGGGVYAYNSQISLGHHHTECKLESLLVFKNNFAMYQGGGIYLEANSNLKLTGPKDNLKRSGCRCTLTFERNNAFEGKAVYVSDETYLSATTCNKHYAQICFFQVSPKLLPRINIVSDYSTKTTIFGGQLHKCVVSQAYLLRFNRDIRPKDYGIGYLPGITHGNTISKMITSKAVGVCHCDNNKDFKCGRQTSSIVVKKGEKFVISVVAVDQVQRPVSAYVKSQLIRFKQSTLEQGQESQKIQNVCTNLSFNAYSFNKSEELFLSTKLQGFCNDSKSYTLNVIIEFDSCTCPIGFVAQTEPNDCKCLCDSRTIPYVQQCNLSNAIRKNDYWIGYNNDTGFITHSFCPYDYCLPPTKSVVLNLLLPNASDVQCAHDRTGLLCGRCKEGYSLSPSTSRCLLCPTVQWPWTLVLFLGKLIGGLILVLAILILNFSVSVGSLNGLIFYANILNAGNSVFFKFTNANFYTVFISWLNLDLGFDTCYFKGMNSYTKSWLQLVFPVYIIVVVVVIILISQCSSKFSVLIGKWNPVAALATLLLFSFTKLLRAIIDILSFTIIEYPTGLHKVVWLSDATVNYTSIKHLPLILTAIIITVLGLVYTIMLVSWQWLQKAPNKWIFKWIRNTRLNMFMEANLAPFEANCRYWMGLLLLIRIALYIGLAANKSHSKYTIATVFAMVASSIFLIRTFVSGSVYKKRLIEYLTLTSHYNLLALSIATLYCQDSLRCQIIASKISVGTAFILFIIIVCYHVLCAIMDCKCIGKNKLLEWKHKLKNYNNPNYRYTTQNSEMVEAHSVIPTCTEVSISSSKANAQDECSEQKITARKLTYSNRLRESLLQD